MKHSIYVITTLITQFFTLSESIELHQECRREKIGLQQDAILQQKFIKTVRSGELVKNECNSDGDDLACVFDYSEVSRSVQDVCMDEGGRFLETGFGALCGKDQEKLQIYYNQYPLCLGFHCEDDDVANVIEDVVKEIEFNLRDQGFDCDVNKLRDNETSSGSLSLSWFSPLFITFWVTLIFSELFEIMS